MSDRWSRWFDRHFVAVFVVICAGMMATIVMRATVTPFSHDEIYTVLGSRLPLTTLWTATRDGLDLAPPFNTALTHVVHSLFGAGRVLARLPPLAGFMTAFVLVAVMARRRSNAMVGISAALMLSHTGAYAFAYEARGYGVMTGCFAVALYCWSEYAAGRSGRVALAGLTFAIAAGLWTHYYFVFALGPIVCGEAARQWFRRRFERQVWVAIALAMLAATPLALLLRVSLTQAGTFWTRLQHPGVWEVYSFLLETLAGSRFRVVAAAIAVLLVGSAVRRRFRGSERRIGAHEVVAGVACLAIPLCAIAFARTIGHDVFVPRYVVFATAALALVISLLIWRLGPPSGVVDVVMLSILLIFFVRGVWRTFEPGRLVPVDRMASHAALTARAAADELTVVTGGIEFIEFWYHTPPERRARLVYVADPSGELDQTGTDTIDRGYIALARWSDVGIADAAPFLERHRDFVLYDAGAFWLQARLRGLGATFEELARDPKGTLYRVRLPPATRQ